MELKVLMVDDDEEILNSFQRNFRKSFQLDTARNAEEGLALLRAGTYMVVVSDYMMPKMDGIQFLGLVREGAPDTTRMLLTGYADTMVAIEAVNKGHIFRFLTKPCAPEVLERAIQAGIEYYRLITAEKELLEQTLSGSVSMLVEILSLVNPSAFSRAARIKQSVAMMVKKLNLSPSWSYELAATLSQIGFVTLPASLLEKIYLQEKLTDQEKGMFGNHPIIAQRLVEKIPRLELIAKMIGGQGKPFFDYPSLPFSQLPKDPVVIGAQLLKVAMDYDTLAGSGHSHIEIMRTMEARKGLYNLEILYAMGEPASGGIVWERQKINLIGLKAGMLIDEDLYTVERVLLLRCGQEVTETVISRLMNIHSNAKIKEPFQVLSPKETR
jgi:response regulator RpfG family c-di-GMP phosphodiesterase